MNKKILTAVIALSIVATSAFAQTKTLSAPVKTDPTTGTQTQTQTAPTKTAPQTVTPPEVVATKFKTMYPAVQGVKWVLGKQGNYGAMFKNGGSECRTIYSPAGLVIREVKVIQKSALPTSVTANLDKNYAGKTPKRIEEIKNAKGKMTYVIKYDDKVVRLDAYGNEVKQSEEMEETK